MLGILIHQALIIFFSGNYSGFNNTTGERNIYIGYGTGYHNSTGEDNVFIGFSAGSNVSGNGNVFIGDNAGASEYSASNKLYIENSNSSTPLIYGEFDNDLLQINGTLSVTQGFADIDADTKIQVEEGSDEDIIRFDLAGTEFLKLDSGRVEIVNTGQSIFIGNGAGENDDYSDNRNVFIGHEAGLTNTSGRWNVFTGYETGHENTTGKQNVFTGFRAGYSNETGENNIFTGYNSGYSNTSGVENTIIGDNAGYNNTTGSNNTFIGHQAGYNSGTGSNNIFIGNQAGYTETGNDKLYIENSNTSSPLIYGDFDTDILEFNASVGIGTTPTNGKFEVLGQGNSLASYTYGYLNNSGATGTWTNAPAYSIYADGRIGGFAFHAHSDERIKNIKGISNNQDDLNTLMNIQITDYTLKDTITNGNQITKKVIAQQVAKVYPQAVSKNTTQVIPDIYQTAEMDKKRWISFSTIDNRPSTFELKKGEKVQIIFDNKKELLEVLEVTEDAFRVAKSEIRNPKSEIRNRFHLRQTS